MWGLQQPVRPCSVRPHCNRRPKDLPAAPTGPHFIICRQETLIQARPQFVRPQTDKQPFFGLCFIEIDSILTTAFGIKCGWNIVLFHFSHYQAEKNRRQTRSGKERPGSSPGRSTAILAFCYAVFYFTGVSVKSLMATPYCGGWLRQNRRVFSPSSRVSVIGSESCRFPTVKGISMAVSESAPFTETLSR